MLRYCTGVSEGLNSPQCYCPRLRHPEVINGLLGLPSRTPPRQKKKKKRLGKQDALRVFHVSTAFRAENAPAHCGEGDGGAGKGMEVRGRGWRRREGDGGAEKGTEVRDRGVHLRLPTRGCPRDWTGRDGTGQEQEPTRWQHRGGTAGGGGAVGRAGGSGWVPAQPRGAEGRPQFGAWMCADRQP